SGVNVVVQSRLTSAGLLYAVKMDPMTLLLMKARNACRGTPALLASNVISERLSITTPKKTLCAILQILASSPSPTYATPRGAKTSISGRAVRQASSGPETTADSFPARIVLALPLTGAA